MRLKWLLKYLNAMESVLTTYWSHDLNCSCSCSWLVLVYMAGGKLLFTIHALKDYVSQSLIGCSFIVEPNFVNRFNWVFVMQSMMGICCSVLTLWHILQCVQLFHFGFREVSWVSCRKNAPMALPSHRHHYHFAIVPQTQLFNSYCFCKHWN